jgi:PAS domain S-box-containing protein
MLDPRTSETEFRLVADNAPVMIWRAGTDKLCDWFNKPWLDFTGRVMEQEVGNGWTEGVHPEDFERCLEVYTGSFDRRDEFSMEYRLRRRDGEYRWLLDNGRPFYRYAEFAGYFGSCIDVTAHRNSEDRLRALLLEREELLREVHHRVNNNLQTLTALLRLRGRTADESGKHLLEELNHRVTAMAAVQRYLHTPDSLSGVSARQFLRAILSEVSSPEPEIAPQDFQLSLTEAANVGLAAAEAVALLRHPTNRVCVALHTSERTVMIEGTTSGEDDTFALQLVRAYSSAAGGTLKVNTVEPSKTCFVISLHLDPL